MTLTLAWRQVLLHLSRRVGKALRLWLINLAYFVVILLYCCAWRQVLIRVPGLESFPASVIGMLFFYLCLVLLTKLSRPASARFLRLFQPRAEFCLKYMNIMFLPSTLNIINSNAISGVDFVKIAFFFVIVYIVFFSCTVYVMRLVRYVMYFGHRTSSEQDTLPTTTAITLPAAPLGHDAAPRGNNDNDAPPEVMFMDDIVDDASLSENDAEKAVVTARTSQTSITMHQHASAAASTIGEKHQGDFYDKFRALGDHPGNQCGGHDDDDEISLRIDLMLHRWWVACQPSVHTLLLCIICTFGTLGYLALPLTSPALPMFTILSQLPLTVLIYVAMMKLPAKFRLVIHPIISTTAICMAVLPFLYVIKTGDYSANVAKAAISAYYTNRISFYSLIEGTQIGWPGAGDILSSAMNVAIVSLALTVYQNSPSNWRDWLTLLIAALPMVFVSLLLIPMLAYLIRLPQEVCLALTTRTVTTAIGIAISQVIHSNVGIVTCIQCFSAISGPIIGVRLLKLYKVPRDDYLTTGFAMALSSHALGTSYLYETNRPASSISSLSFMLFGTLSVIFVSVPSIADIILRVTGY
ncbi:LrgB-like family-domain-containing protein [Gongronella butleri]|nr:LrgB-like family-domain-containing protein [Gongronella butleri]